jgi:hypothetical protein
MGHPAQGFVHPSGNGSFTGSCPVWLARDYLWANTWRVLHTNPHCSASSIYSTSINRRAHEAQGGEGDDEGGEVEVHLGFIGFRRYGVVEILVKLIIE